MKAIFTTLTAVAAWLMAHAPATAQDKNEIPPAVVKALEKGEKLEVYYLKDARDKEKGFRGYEFTDHFEVKDDKARKEFVSTLVKEVQKSETEGPREFYGPKYGLRVTDKEGKQTDLVISLDSAWGFAYADGKKVGQFRISGEPKKLVGKTFDDLKAHKPK